MHNLYLIIFKYFAANEVARIPIIMVGGKSDLEDNRTISTEEAIEISESYNLFGYFECSSKTGENVEEVFKFITQKMIEKAK